MRYADCQYRLDSIGGIHAEIGVMVGDAHEECRVVDHKVRCHRIDESRDHAGRDGLGRTGNRRKRHGGVGWCCCVGDGTDGAGGVAACLQGGNVGGGHGRRVAVLCCGCGSMRLGFSFRELLDSGGVRGGAVGGGRARGARGHVRQGRRTSFSVDEGTEVWCECLTLATRRGVVGAVGRGMALLSAETAGVSVGSFPALLACVSLDAADEARLGRIRVAAALLPVTRLATRFGVAHGLERCNQGRDVCVVGAGRGLRSGLRGGGTEGMHGRRPRL